VRLFACKSVRKRIICDKVERAHDGYTYRWGCALALILGADKENAMVGQDEWAC
jgi:hypothetical protein